MIIRSMTLLSLVFTPAASGWAQDLLACVDPDVKEALIFPHYPDVPVLSHTVPAPYADLGPLQDLEFIGSSVASFQTSVAYKSALTLDAALETVRGALTGAGWNALPGPDVNRGGFVSNVQPAFAMLCRNDQTVNIVARQAQNATFVTLSSSNQQRNMSCDAMVSARSGMALMAMPGVHAHMPRLTLPPGARTSNAGAQLGIGGSASSGRTGETTIVIETDLTAQSLLGHFTQQLQDQGWAQDTGWSGLVSAGATWSARPSNDMRLAGLLEIIALEDASYQASFRATQVN